MHWKRVNLTALAVLAGLFGIVDAKAATHDTVYHNGKIYTMTESAAEAADVKNAKTVDVVTTRDGKIVFAGSKAEAEAGGYMDARNTVDLKGKTMLPGFVDGHGHFPGQGAQDLYTVFLGSPPLGTMNSIADYQDALRAACGAAEASPGGVSGSNYDDTLIAEMRHPTRYDIDAVAECSGKRVYLTHISGHMGVANTQVLLDSDIISDVDGTPGPKAYTDETMTTLVPGVVVDGNGKVTGLLQETNAMGLALKPVIAQNAQKGLARASEVFAAKGVTLADAGGVIAGQQELAFQEGINNGGLKVRVAFHPIMYTGAWQWVLSNLGWENAYAGATPADLIAAGARPGPDTPAIGADMTRWTPTNVTAPADYVATLPENMILMGAYKIIADGSPQGYTAWMKDPGYYDWGDYTAADRCTINTINAISGIPMPNSLIGTKYDAEVFNGATGSINVPPQDIAALIELMHMNNVSTETHTNGTGQAEAWVEALELAVSRHPGIEDTRHTSIHAQTFERQHIQRLVGDYDGLGDLTMYRQLFGALEGGQYNADAVGGLSPADLGALMKKQNFLASFFMTHTYYYGERHWDIFFGPGRARNISPAGWAIHYGLNYSFHNDNVITPIEPLQSVESAVTRLSAKSFVSPGGRAIHGEGKDVDAVITLPGRAENGVPVPGSEQRFYEYDQRINVLQALHGITINPAWQNKISDRIGSIEAGKLADFVILDNSPFVVAEQNPTLLSDIRVVTTIVGDEPIYGILPGSTTYAAGVQAASADFPNLETPADIVVELLGDADIEKLRPLDQGQIRYGAFSVTAGGTPNERHLFQMRVLGNGSTVGDFMLYNPGATGNTPVRSSILRSSEDRFQYTRSSEDLARSDAMFSIASTDTPLVLLDSGARLEMDKPYLVYFTLPADADGSIAATVDLASTGTAPANDTSVPGIVEDRADFTGHDDDGDSSGCTVGSNPSYDLPILLGMILVLLGLRAWRRRHNAA